MEIEFPYHNLAFEREKEMSIFYRGHEIGARRVDFFIENLIMVKLKAVIQLERRPFCTSHELSRSL